MTLQTELIALYQITVKELENDQKWIQDHKTSPSQWDQDIIKTLTVSCRCLINKRNDIGEILWHSGIDVTTYGNSGDKEGEK